MASDIPQPVRDLMKTMTREEVAEELRWAATDATNKHMMWPSMKFDRHAAALLLAAQAVEREQEGPKTVDGKPIRLRENLYAVICMNEQPPVYAVVSCGFIQIVQSENLGFFGVVRDGNGDVYDVEVEQCYSTEAAASAALAGQEAHMHRPLSLPADRTDRIRRAIESDDGTSVSARNPQEKP